MPHPTANDFIPSRPPNIVFIMADDLGYGDLGCFGSREIDTPHIDRLAAEGLTFTDHHANGAVCTPTRAALLTGRYQQRCGLDGVIYVRERDRGLDPQTEYCLAHALRDAGYATALLGKWHLGFKPEFNPVRHGFDLFRGYVSGNVDYHSHVDNAGHPDWWHNLERIEETGYVTDLIGDHAVAFIREHREQPFFLYLAHEAPHFPYQGRGDKPDRFPGRTDFHGWGSRLDRKAAYKEMIEAMDDGVGRILDTVRELALANDTLIVFCSDNGAIAEVGSNGALHGEKGDLFEGGHRVPAIARWPGRISAGSTTGETVMSMDWLPTFMTLAGCRTAPPKPLDGCDVSDILFQRARPPERTTYFAYRDHAAMRRGKWKLLRRENDISLFDLEADFGERDDLAARHPRRVAAMADELDQWVRDVTGE